MSYSLLVKPSAQIAPESLETAVPSYRFLVKSSARLPVANVWILDGELLSGKIKNDSTAVAMTDCGAIKVRIKTVAFLNSNHIEPNEFSLTIELPSFDLKLLEGKILAGE